MGIEQRTARLINRFRSRLPDEYVVEYVSLTRHNECAIAFENLCTQLYEYEVTPSETECLDIQQLATDMGLPDDVWSFLLPSKPA